MIRSVDYFRKRIENYEDVSFISLSLEPFYVQKVKEYEMVLGFFKQTFKEYENRINNLSGLYSKEVNWDLEMRMSTHIDNLEILKEVYLK